MFPAATNMAGMSMTMGPTDVCKTPVGPAVVPIPYPNFAMNPLAIKFAITVTAVKRNAYNLGSEIPISTGDEAGVAGGIVSSQFIGPSRPVMGSMTVFAEGLPWVKLLSPTTQNGKAPNMVGAVLVPSQPMVLITV